MTSPNTVIPPAADAAVVRQSFAGLPECVAEVREFLTSHLAGTAWPVGDVVLAADELAANAVLHSRSGQGGKVDIRLRIKPGRMVQVEICDQGPRPTPPAAGTRRCEGGLGLPIVKALTSEHGDYTDPITGFHIAWFRILASTPAAAAGGAPIPEGRASS